MTCDELARRIQQLEPRATPQDVARVCLLLANNQGDLDALRDAGIAQAAGSTRA